MGAADGAADRANDAMAGGAEAMLLRGHHRDMRAKDATRV